MNNERPYRTLANDVARCDGVSYEEYGTVDWREGCETCLRRTAPRPKNFTIIEPPEIVACECEYLIDPAIEQCRDEDGRQPAEMTANADKPRQNVTNDNC